ncbi:MAG TPA: hypothetical protein PKD54_11590 [Pirellulaceae bacterium]|nr:hypothetical protein [Pirellulaceae bacterium]
MKITSILTVVGVGLLVVSAGLLAYERYTSLPPKFEIAVKIPENIESNVQHSIPAVIYNGTKQRLRIVGWSSC